MLKVNLFVIIYIILLAVYELYQFKKRDNHGSLEYWVLKIAFYIYFILLIWVTLFPIPIQELELDGLRMLYGNGLKYNFVPFKSMIEVIKSNVHYQTKLKEIGGNFILLIPIAFYLPIRKIQFQKLSGIILLLFSASLCIEFLQFAIGFVIRYHYRIVDIDDVLLNVSGGVFGYIAWKIFHYLNKGNTYLKLNVTISK